MNKMKLCVMLGSFVMLGGCMATVSPSGRVSMAYVPTSTVVVEKHHRGVERRYHHTPFVQYIYTKTGPRYAYYQKQRHGKKHGPVIVQPQARPDKGHRKAGLGKGKPAPKGKLGQPQTHFGKGGHKGQEKRTFQTGSPHGEQKIGGKQQAAGQAKQFHSVKKSTVQQGKQPFGRGQTGQQSKRGQTAKRSGGFQRQGR